MRQTGLNRPFRYGEEGTFKMRKQKGFSLIELLIVVAIILIIAAIAIPNLLRARIAANESSAVSSIRTINTAEVTYQSAYPTVGYAPNLVSLGPGAGVQTCPGGGPTQAAACLVDAALANNVANTPAGKSGYSVDAAGLAGTGTTLLITYGIGAAPLAFNQTGVRRFCSAEDGVLRADPNTGGSTTVVTTSAGCTAAPYIVMQ
jgi:type IV pilus assembly protein PilA